MFHYSPYYQITMCTFDTINAYIHISIFSGYGMVPNGPSNGLPGQSFVQANEQPRLISSTPPLISMVNHPSRPGSAPPPGTGPQTSSPIYPPTQAFGVHSLPSTPSSLMPTSNISSTQQGNVQHTSGPHRPGIVQPSFGGAPVQNFNSTSGLNQSVRPSSWQASMSGHQLGTASPVGSPGALQRPLSSLTQPPTSLTRLPTSLTRPPTSLTRLPTSSTGPPTGPPTNLTGPPATLTGPPSRMTRPASSVARPTNLTGSPTGVSGWPANLTQSTIRPPATTPTGQMMGATGQPLMPPMPHSSSISPGM